MASKRRFPDRRSGAGRVREQVEAAAPAELLGLKARSLTDLLARIEEGVSYSALERFQRQVALSLEEVCELIRVPMRTLTRRRAEGRLRPDESDRLLRASRVYAEALALFEGDAEATRAWLASPQPALADAAPWQIARTDVGTREVERLIGRLEHGIPS